MFLYRTVAVVAILTHLGVTSASRSEPPILNVQKITYLPNTYMIELEPGSSLAGREIVDVHASFHKRIPQHVDYKIRKEFRDDSLFFGLSIEVKNGTSIAEIQNIPEVKKLWPVRLVERAAPYLPGMNTTSSWKTSSNYKRADSETLVPTINGTSDVLSYLKMCEVDRVHELGITGKGIKVGIVDSGVDYRHPALGGGFGAGYKIETGYDFVGDDFVGDNTAVPDSDPLTTCMSGGHGTHVSGIVAGNDPDGVGFGILGVAPDARLGMYRVFGCGGTTPEDIIMAAIMKAADDGADVISMSLGGRAGWEFFDNYGTIVSNLESRNIGLIASAGNSGEEGPYYASTPSLSPGIISVGSVSNTKFPTMYNAKDSLGRTIEYASNFPWDVPNGMDIWMMGNATDDPTYDFFQSGCWESGWWVAAENIPEENRPNTLVVIPAMPAVCAIADLTENMLHFNFTKLFLYVWDQDGHDMSVWPPGSYGAVEMIKTTQHHAEKIVSGASKSNAYTISFTDKTVHSIKQVTAGTVSYFSSYGPTVEMSLKPQLSAPGGNILSSWPLEGNGYVTISGTSMAAPFVAGCYALIKSQFQTLSPSEIRILMQTTSTPLKEYNGDILTSTAQQGSGLINPYKAITYESRVLTGELNWRDSEAPAPQEITIENKSSRSKTYIIGHQGAAYMDVFPWYDNDDSDWLSWSLVNEAKYSTVTFSANSITIPAGKAANIVVTLSPPKTTQVNRLPFYSGYVTIQNNNDHFNVPYIGVPYTRSEQSHLDNTDFAGFVLPRVRSVYPATSVEDLRVFTFRAAVPVEDEDQDDDDPAVLSFWVKQISPYFRWDLVPADTTFVPTYYGFNQSNKFPVIEPPIDIGELDTFHNVSSYGTLFGVSNVDSPTNSRFYGLVGTTILSSLVWTAPVTFLANETWIILPDGDYRPLLRVMRWGGNWENPDDFESWLGPVLRVAYNPLALPPVLED